MARQEQRGNREVRKPKGEGRGARGAGALRVRRCQGVAVDSLRQGAEEIVRAPFTRR